MDLWGRRGGSEAAGGLISGEAGGLGGVRLSELASAPLKARKSTTQREKQQACARKRATSRHGARGSRSTREQPVEHIHRHLGDPACSLPHRAQIHACQAVAGRGESWLAALNGTQAQPKKIWERAPPARRPFRLQMLEPPHSEHEGSRLATSAQL